MTAATLPLACPLRRSSRLAHAHAHAHAHPSPPPPAPRPRHHRPPPDPELDVDSSSDPENELTPRALRALKRQRLALDLDGLPIPARPRPRKRRKENIPHPKRAPSQRSKRLSSPPSPLAPRRTDISPSDLPSLPFPPSADDSSILLPLVTNALPPSSPPHGLSTPLSSPLTPLTPTPLPSPSPPPPSLDPHPMPPVDPTPPPIPMDIVPLPPVEPLPPLHPPSLPTESLSLDALETLIPFESLATHFDSPMTLHLDAHAPQSSPQQLPQDPYPPQQPPYPSTTPPSPAFVRDREVNIWKLACQERVDYLFRRFGVETIKAVVACEASAASPDVHSLHLHAAPSLTQPGQTRFRLYTPASYTWGSGASATPSTLSTKQQLSNDGDMSHTKVESMSAEVDGDADLLDAGMDMDEDDFDDDEDVSDVEAVGDPGLGLGAEMQGLTVSTPHDVCPGKGEVLVMTMDVEAHSYSPEQANKENGVMPPPSPSSFSTLPHLHLLTPPFVPPPLRPQIPPLSSLHVPLLSEPSRAFMGRGTPPDRRRLEEWSISSCRAACQAESMGVNVGTGIYVPMSMSMPMVSEMHPQTPSHEHTHVHVHTEMRPLGSPAQPPQQAGEWTSFLHAMLESDGMSVEQGNTMVANAGVGSAGVSVGAMAVEDAAVSSAVDVGVCVAGGPGQADGTGWYELELSVGFATDIHGAGIGLSHFSGHGSHEPAHNQPHTAKSVQGPAGGHVGQTRTGGEPVEDASSSTLRFALG